MRNETKKIAEPRQTPGVGYVVTFGELLRLTLRRAILHSVRAPDKGTPAVRQGRKARNLPEIVRLPKAKRYFTGGKISPKGQTIHFFGGSMTATPRKFLLPLFAGALALGACDESPTAGGQARLSIQLTDAPSDYLASATVEIGRIEILPADDGAPITVVENAGSYDLLQLQNGVTADLGGIDIEPGRYTQLRMIVESAELTLAEGYTFTDGSTTQQVKVPSGAQTGIKIDLTTADGDADAGVEIRPGETVLVVDFDVSENFVMQGSADTPAGIQGFLFTPQLRAVVRDVAGSIAGTVTAPEGVSVEGWQVTATRVGAAEGEAPASTLAAADGSYTIQFVAPATYAVTVVAPEGHTASSVEVTVGEDEDVSGVNLEVSAAS